MPILILIFFLFFPVSIYAQEATPSATPTPVLNPSSGIILSEFMPYSSIEWVEIFNQNDFSVSLNGWKVQDSINQTGFTTDNLIINSKSYVYVNSNRIFNDTGDKIVFKNNNDVIVEEFEYDNGYYSLDKSWSKVDGSWCQANISQGQPNSSCYVTPTNTPIPTNNPTPTPTPIPTNTPTLTPTNTSTPTPNLNKYKATESATASVTMVPIEEELLETPTGKPTGVVLGQSQSVTNKKNYLPLILVIGGGLLLLTPVFITKLKK